MQGLHPVPLSRFVTSVSRAKLILEEAARLLTLLWRVSLPTDGQCTLHCEQVCGDTWCRGSGVPLRRVSQSPARPARTWLTAVGCSVWGLSEGREGIVPGTKLVLPVVPHPPPPLLP